MKQEFEMTQAEMDDIIVINKSQMPVMLIGNVTTGMDLQERINAYWEGLGNKYGFKPMTVEGSVKGKLFFLAEPKPIIAPKVLAAMTIERLTAEARVKNLYFLYWKKKGKTDMAATILSNNPSVVDFAIAFAAQEVAAIEMPTEFIDKLWGVLENSPELNMNNYNHDEACALNSSMIEVYQIVDEFRSRMEGNK